jgi:hypothetical protein
MSAPARGRDERLLVRAYRACRRTPSQSALPGIQTHAPLLRTRSESQFSKKCRCTPAGHFCLKVPPHEKVVFPVGADTPRHADREKPGDARHLRFRGLFQLTADSVSESDLVAREDVLRGWEWSPDVRNRDI